MVGATKKRRKPDGSTEVVSDCPVCGSRNNYEINLSTRKHHCWSCGYGGRYTEGSWHTSVDASITPDFVPTRTPGPITAEIPEYGLRAIARRGFDPDYVVRTYDVQWDGSRLCWPTGEGFARRAVYPWETPKVLSAGPKGLIGVGRLRYEQHIVLVEGDFKAAAIPAPWIGLGTQGTELTERQISLLATYSPASVTTMLDVGYEAQAMKMRDVLRKVLPAKVQVNMVPCPRPGPGPDDVPRMQLTAALLAVHKEIQE